MRENTEGGGGRDTSRVEKQQMILKKKRSNTKERAKKILVTFQVGSESTLTAFPLLDVLSTSLTLHRPPTILPPMPPFSVSLFSTCISLYIPPAAALASPFASLWHNPKPIYMPIYTFMPVDQTPSRTETFGFRSPTPPKTPVNIKRHKTHWKFI